MAFVPESEFRESYGEGLAIHFVSFNVLYSDSVLQAPSDTSPPQQPSPRRRLR